MKELNIENVRRFFEEQKEKHRGKEKYISGDAEFSFLESIIEIDIFSDWAIHARFRVRQDDTLVFSACVLFSKIHQLDAGHFIRQLDLEVEKYITQRLDEINFLEKVMCGIANKG